MRKTWEIAARGNDRLGESALWHPTQNSVYWVDLYGSSIHRLDPSTGARRDWSVPETTILGSIAFLADGRLLIAIDRGVCIFDLETESSKVIVHPEEGRVGVAYNDAKVDRFGRYWFGTYDVAEAEPRGILYRLESGRAVVADSGYLVTNGPAFSPDGAVLYFSDTNGRRLFAYDVDVETGRLLGRRLFATFGPGEGNPDGLTVDREGCVWCAQYIAGRVSRFDPDGNVKSVIQLPAPNVTSCCLGGEALTTLYVTSGWTDALGPGSDGGSLFAIEVDVPGLPEPFARIDR